MKKKTITNKPPGTVILYGIAGAIVLGIIILLFIASGFSVLGAGMVLLSGSIYCYTVSVIIEAIRYDPEKQDKIIELLPNNDKSRDKNHRSIPHLNKEAGLRITDVAVMTPPSPRFEVHGFGREYGRKRERTYWAKDLDEAINKASKDGIIVDVRACK